MPAIPQQPTVGAPAPTDLAASYPPAPSTDGPSTRTWASVLRGLLAGREEDFWGGFQPASAFLDAGAQDRRGAWCLATNAAGAPTAQDSANLRDLADGDYTLCVSTTMRSDADNNVWALEAAKGAADYPLGRIIYAHVPGDPDNFAKLTLTAGGTLVGQGNAAYIYAPVTVDETGDLYDGADWNRFSETVPPDVAVDSSLIKSLGSLWDRMLVVLEATGSILKRARQIIQGNNETQTLSVTRVNATPTGPGEIWLGNVQNGTGQALLWPPAATKDGTAFEVEDLREFKAGDFLSYGGLEWEIGDTPWTTFQGSVLQANVVLAEGYVYDANDVPALNAVADFVLEGRDIHLGLVVAAILKRAANNLGGKGGAAGKVWGYLSSATNATWRRLLDVLRADADTAARKADYAAALATGRLQKSVTGITELTLGTSEAAYDSVEFTGLKTSDVVVTLPAAPSGMRLVRNLSTGDYALKLKAAGQSDAAAVVLHEGDNQVLHHGGSLAVVGRVDAPTAGTHRTANHVLVEGDIGQWNSFMAQGAGVEISLSGGIGTVGDRIVLACRSSGNYDIDLKWVAGTLKLFSARGIHTLNAAGTAELIGSGGNQRAVFVAVKSGADEWTVREGIWEAN